VDVVEEDFPAKSLGLVGSKALLRNVQ